MSVPKNKEELLMAIHTNYEKLKKEVDSVRFEMSSLPELEGHSKETLMSINNLLAYLVGWGELVLKWNHRKENSQAVDFPETGFKWNELGKLAQKFYKDYESDDFNILKKKLDDTVKKILQLVVRKSDEELYGADWYEKWTLGRMIQFNTSSPYLNAVRRIRKWKKEKGLQ